MSAIKDSIKYLLGKAGYKLNQYDPVLDFDFQQKILLERNSIDLVLDVGANTGQYAEQLRRGGYHGGIISFEPLSSAYKGLSGKAEVDKKWQACHFGLGGADCELEINIAGNSYSSSILEMGDEHVKASPASRYLEKEVVTIRKLDSVYESLCKNADNIFLKIDTQGYTREVLAGAESSMKNVRGLCVEMSLVELYRGEPLIDEVVASLYRKNYRLLSLAPEFIDRTRNRLLQVNGLFEFQD